MESPMSKSLFAAHAASALQRRGHPEEKRCRCVAPVMMSLANARTDAYAVPIVGAGEREKTRSEQARRCGVAIARDPKAPRNAP